MPSPSSALFPIALIGASMLAVRGYRKRDPIAILLSTAAIFPLLSSAAFPSASAAAGRCSSGPSPLPASQST